MSVSVALNKKKDLNIQKKGREKAGKGLAFHKIHFLYNDELKPNQKLLTSRVFCSFHACLVVWCKLGIKDMGLVDAVCLYIYICM